MRLHIVIAVACSLALILGVVLSIIPHNAHFSGVELSSVLGARASEEIVAVRFQSRSEWPTNSACDITVSVSPELAKYWQISGLSVYEVKDGERFLLSSKTPVLYEQNSTVYKWGMPAISESKFDLELYLKRLASFDSEGKTIYAVPNENLVKLAVTPQSRIQ